MSPKPTGLAWNDRDHGADRPPDLDSELISGVVDQVHLRHPFPAWNQKTVPCCVSCSVTTSMEILDAQQGDSTRLSPLFNYYYSRAGNQALQEIGLSEGLNAATVHGVAPHHAHAPTFTVVGARQTPSGTAKTLATAHRLAPEDSAGGLIRKPPYQQLGSLTDVSSWKRAIAAGLPLVLGFRLGAFGERLKDSGETILQGIDHTGFGHAVVVHGYDDHFLGSKHGAFRIKDSRGARVGRRGSWWLPYNLIADGFARELWIVTRISYDA